MFILIYEYKPYRMFFISINNIMLNNIWSVQQAIQEPVETIRVNTWIYLSKDQKNEILKNLRAINNIKQAENIININNNKSLSDYFHFCIKFPDDVQDELKNKQLSIDSTTSFRCDLFDIISPLLSK